MGDALIVCDPETKAAACLGDDVYCLPSKPKPTEELAQTIVEAIGDHKQVIAVGSGTINDLCKYAASLSGVPYSVYATALSMNGYASRNASIIDEHGVKRTHAATLPQQIVIDTEVTDAAPKRLMQAGIGDSLCRSTAQFDWLLSELIGAGDYNETPFKLLGAIEDEFLAKPTDPTLLAETLILSGIGMTIAGGSYPASQGEHLIAHAMEVVAPQGEHYHGEEIAVTTLTMARLHEQLLASDKAPGFIPREQDDVAEHLWEEYQLKAQQADAINETLQSKWNDIKEKLADVHIPAEQLEKILKDVGAPTTPSNLGWSENDYANAQQLAPTLRNRFTTLDLSF